MNGKWKTISVPFLKGLCCELQTLEYRKLEKNESVNGLKRVYVLVFLFLSKERIKFEFHKKKILKNKKEEQ